MLVIHCSRCGEKVKVSPDETGLWQGPDGCSLFRLTCPRCGLRSCGCLEQGDLDIPRSPAVSAIVVPAEAREEHTGAPLTLDDLIDLHFLLQSSDWEKPLRRTGNKRWARRVGFGRGAGPGRDE